MNNGDKSANSVNVALDFTGPSVGQTLLVPDSSTAKTDSGTSDNDNITNIQKPVVTFISEDNLGKSNIFIDLADGKGVAKFDTAPLILICLIFRQKKYLIQKRFTISFRISLKRWRLVSMPFFQNREVIN